MIMTAYASFDAGFGAKPMPKYRRFCLCPLKMTVVVYAMPQTPLLRRPTQSDPSCVIKRSDPADLPAWALVAPKQIGAAACAEPTPLAADEWMTVAEVAQFLRLSKRTVSRMIKAGRLPAKRLGRAVRIARSQLMAMLTSLPPASEKAGACRE
ncbi:helix-turn-helix domain-containing protein [Novosphingobium sp.]|jgi:excisionase family DNA binding protein|uniref:helix-turn-helix domain-containing protein n=1 Tax=Novosphingobium sp. TaxID=1874826 RepID=UPI00301A4BFC